MRTYNYLKKFVFISLSTLVVTFVGVTNVRAQDPVADGLLAAIKVDTDAILVAVQRLPNQIQQMITAALNAYMQQTWLKPDDAASGLSASSLIPSFTALDGILLSDKANQDDPQFQLKLIAAMLHQPLSSFSSIGNKGPQVLLSVPNLNEITYTTLLGVPPINLKNATSAGDPALAYIRNASTENFVHELPPPLTVTVDSATGAQTWDSPVPVKDKASLLRYKLYFDTIMAAKTFGGYVLSDQYADKNQLSQTQSDLLKKASDTSPNGWYANIASEDMGSVYRQLLMFESQNFILMTQLVRTQKQLLTAQVLTNSLLIANNRLNEGLMADKAFGRPIS